MKTLSFSRAISVSEKEKWLKAVTNIEATISVFKISDDNSSFSITKPGHWNSKSAKNTVDDLKKNVRA